MHRRILTALALTTTLVLPIASATAQCTPHFVTGYSGPVLSGQITAATSFNGEIYISGTLQLAPSTATVYLAKYANNTWVAVPGPTLNAPARTMLVRTENGQQVMYLGGTFTSAGGLTTASVARWTGQTWSAFAGSSPLPFTSVEALEFYDDGAGEALYAAGAVPSNGGGIAKWNGAAWTPLGASSISGTSAVVRALEVFDDGSGPKLYVGGSFNAAGGAPAHGIAAWDGAGWHQAHDGLLASGATWPTAVFSLATHNDLTGPKLYAAGVLNTPSRNFGNTAVACLEGGTWLNVLGQPEFANTGAGTELVSATDDNGPVLYAVTGSSDLSMDQVRRLQNGAWTSVGPRVSAPATGGQPVTEILSIPNNGVPTIFAFGSVAVHWSGQAWEPTETYGFGLDPDSRLSRDPEDPQGVYFVDGRAYRDGIRLPDPGPIVPSVGIARFSDNGVSTLVYVGVVDTAFNDGSGWTTLAPGQGGANLVRAGRDEAGESAFAARTSSLGTKVLRFTNGAWVQVGPTIERSTLGHEVNVVHTYDNGSGPRIFVGGYFARSGGPASFLLMLVNNQWVEVPGVDGRVNDLATFDFGEGPELVMAGNFSSSGGVGTSERGVCRWNGTRIANIGLGLGLAGIGNVLAVYDRGDGPKLYAGADNLNLGVRVWNGSSWTGIGGFSTGARITGLAPVARAEGAPSLFISGSFVSAGGTFSSNIAEYAGCRPTCTADIDADGDVGTDADIEAFFACLAGNCCLTCASQDFNNDGDFGTDADIEAFFRVLAGGNC